MPIRYFICIGKSTRVEAKSTYVGIALDVLLDTASKAVAGSHRTVEMFVITAKAEPSLGVPARAACSMSRKATGVVLDVIWVRVWRTKRGMNISPPQQRWGLGRGVGGRELVETQQLRILYGGGSDGVSRGR